LGAGLPEAAAGFLAWRLPALSIADAERPFFAFGLVAVALLAFRDAFAPPEVDRLIAFVEEEEAAVRDPTGACTPDMFGRSFLAETCFDQRHGAWRALAARVRSSFPNAVRLVGLARRIEAG
jgi:hypothetical protein